MKTNVKASVIKSAAALICCAIFAFSSLTAVNKICDNKMEISKTSAGITNEFSDNEITDEQTISPENSESIQPEADTMPKDEQSSETETVLQPGSQAADKNSNSTSYTPATNKTAEKKISLTSGLTSTDINEVLEYYKLVAKANSKIVPTRSMTLASMSGGNNMLGKFVSQFETIAKKALSKNSDVPADYPGAPQKIMASDWLSVSAKNNGRFTTVKVKVRPQVDGPNGRTYEGPVGRSIGVLDGFDKALEELEVVSADFENGNVEIQYQNPQFSVTVENSTGKLVKNSCRWSYRTHPILHTLDAKVMFVSVHLEEANGNIDYIVKY